MHFNQHTYAYNPNEKIFSKIKPLEDLPLSASSNLPVNFSLGRSVRKWRSEGLVAPPNPLTKHGFRKPLKHAITSYGDKLMLYDSGVNDIKRVLFFGTKSRIFQNWIVLRISYSSELRLHGFWLIFILQNNNVWSWAVENIGWNCTFSNWLVWEVHFAGIITLGINASNCIHKYIENLRWDEWLSWNVNEN